MHDDYEDTLTGRIDRLLEDYELTTLLEQCDITETEALVKLIMEGHIDEAQLPTLC